MTDSDQLDVAIVGGGPGGVIALYYATQAGLKTILLEKQDTVGGLWARLPAWQDIQNRAEDWTLGDLPIAGVDQPSILANIQHWVRSIWDSTFGSVPRHFPRHRHRKGGPSRRRRVS
jgi:cation diffusion facilitator CzcD-associated flavoprotein CzcO